MGSGTGLGGGEVLRSEQEAPIFHIVRSFIWEECVRSPDVWGRGAVTYDKSCDASIDICHFSQRMWTPCCTHAGCLHGNRKWWKKLQQLPIKPPKECFSLNTLKQVFSLFHSQSLSFYKSDSFCACVVRSARLLLLPVIRLTLLNVNSPIHSVQFCTDRRYKTVRRRWTWESKEQFNEQVFAVSGAGCLTFTRCSTCATIPI